MNQLAFVSQVVYMLKNLYGVNAYLVYRISSTTDLETGAKSVNKNSIFIPKLIVLPSQVQRKFDYDLTFIANNKTFTYGGLFDPTKRKFILDRKDLPSGFEVDNNMYILYDGRKYTIAEHEEFEQRSAYILTCEEDTSAHAENIIEPRSGDTLSLNDGSQNDP